MSSSASPTGAGADLRRLLVAGDLQGPVPHVMTPALAEAVAAAFATVVVIPEAGDAGDATPATLPDLATGTLARPRVVLGRDGRSASLGLAEAVARGLTAAGVDVVDVGLCPGDALTLTAGTLGAPGVYVTGDHAAPPVHGLRLTRGGGRVLDESTGLLRVLTLAEQHLAHGLPGPATQLGQTSSRSVLGDYARALRGQVDLAGARRLTVVVDAGHGVAGPTVPAVLGSAAGLDPLDVEVVLLFADLDPDVPGRGPDPRVPAGLIDLQAAVLAHGADLGLAFDGDGDAVVVVDERGHVVSPSVLVALVALREVARERAAGRRPAIVGDLLTSAAVPDLVGSGGASFVRSAPGRGPMTTAMAQRDAVFGGEHAGHYYFRDLACADSALAAALHLIAALGQQTYPLSDLVEVYQPYSTSGEITSRVPDVEAAVDRVVEAYVAREGAGPVEVDERDGLTLSHWDSVPPWWFNLRAGGSGVVLLVEAADEDIMEKVRDDVLDLVRADGLLDEGDAPTPTEPRTEHPTQHPTQHPTSDEGENDA